MQDRFKFRIPMFTDKGTFMGFQYLELGDFIECTLCGTNGEPQQCTGLKDKNGKLIYEGDIVKDINIPSYFYIVVWFKGGFYLKSTISNSFLVFDTTQQEVIGNIYENPELLKVSNDH